MKLALIWPIFDGKHSSFNELARRLDPQRFETIIICLRKKPDNPESVDKYGRRIYYLTRDRLINAFSPLILWRLLRILKSEKVDILHAHRHKPSFYAFMARVFGSVPVVILHVHGLNRTRNFTRKMLNRFMFKRIDKVLGCANKVCDDVRDNNPSLDPDKVISLENSVDYEMFADAVAGSENIRVELGVDEKVFLFLALGRFAPTKGYGYLLKAFSKVRQENPNCELIIAGDGRDKDKMEELAKSLGLEDSIHMPGNRSDIPQVMKACDCFVMSSIAEGMPLSLLEAMSSGLPCIATGVGGIPEVLISEEIGRVVEPTDVDALAAAMLSYSEMSPEDIEQMKEKSRNRVTSKYSNEVVAKKLQEIYENECKKSKLFGRRNK